MSKRTIRITESIQEVPAVAQYFQRIGATPRSLMTAFIGEEDGGYKRDVCHIRIGRDGEVKVSEPTYAPTPAESAAIREALESVQLPVPAKPKKRPSLPPDIANVDDAMIFSFLDVSGDFLMLQQRIDFDSGKKAYLPWTFFDDGIWRRMEPEGLLPLWGLDQLKDESTAFIHEGAKAARACRELIEARTPEVREQSKAHPWGKELSAAAHLGWIGGARSPDRTDWSILKKHGITRVYIVSDNDEVGRQAVSAISKAIGLPCMHVQFTDEFPSSFDLADPLPKAFFKETEGVSRWVGPTFRSLLHPATWATDVIPPTTNRGRPKVVLRSSFKPQWTYVEESDVFVFNEMPEIIRDRNVLNNMLAGFSDAKDTAARIVSDYKGRVSKLTYRPDTTKRIITEGNSSAINVYTPGLIDPVEGDAAPFFQFLNYLCPSEGDRVFLERHCATLIARPGVRMKFGMLLISERQGIGKTTLAENILAPLVGHHNTSFPTESQILSDFTGWIARKRLVVVAEIYAGNNWRAYNELKQKVTDRHIDVNEKFEKPYTIENWAHIVASSNSITALRLDEDDRRWFCPEVNEQPWTKPQFVEFHAWLQSGGLAIISHWAHHYGSYFDVGDTAPMTARKKEMIQESQSEAQREAVGLADRMVEHGGPLAIFDTQAHGWIKGRMSTGERMIPLHAVRKAMAASGIRWSKQRIRGQYFGRVGFNEAVFRELQRVVQDDTNKDKDREALTREVLHRYVSYADELLRPL